MLEYNPVWTQPGPAALRRGFTWTLGGSRAYHYQHGWSGNARSSQCLNYCALDGRSYRSTTTRLIHPHTHPSFLSVGLCAFCPSLRTAECADPFTLSFSAGSLGDERLNWLPKREAGGRGVMEVLVRIERLEIQGGGGWGGRIVIMAIRNALSAAIHRPG